VKRYNQSAKIEINILNDVREKGGTSYHIVNMFESFIHVDL
jgi:hypothetical protein